MNEDSKKQLLCTLKNQLEQLLFIKTGLINGQTEEILQNNRDLFLRKTKKEVEKIKQEIIRTNERIQKIILSTTRKSISLAELVAHTSMIQALTKKIRNLKFLFDFFSTQLKRLKNHESFILRTDAFILIQKEELYMQLN